MKKLNYLIIILVINCSSQFMDAQQLYRLAISPIQVDISASTVTKGFLNGNPVTTSNVANGMYDNDLSNPGGSHQILFYISDGVVYDKYSTPISSIVPAPNNAEIVIVPFGNNNDCQKKFNIFSMAEIGGLQSVIRSVLDMENYTLVTGSNMMVDQFSFGTEYGALAASKEYHTLDPSPCDVVRYLFSIAASGTLGGYGGAIRRVKICNDGSVISGVGSPNLFPPVPYLNEGNEFFTRELDISGDGLYMAWASWNDITAPSLPNSRYHLVSLSTAGNIQSYQQFNIPNITGNNFSGFRGIEFWQSGITTKLFLGAGSSGIYMTDLALNNYIQVQNSNPDYGTSQIELAYNGLMYASSNNNISKKGYIDAFDPALILPVMSNGVNPGFIFTDGSGNPVHAPCVGSWTNTSEFFYTLPDQIDGEDYSTNLSAPVTQNGSSYDYNFTGAATWTNILNPWNVPSNIQIIHELRISGNSHLTIDGMKFQFSPDAKVVIEQGCSLILVNGTQLTSDYNQGCKNPDTWQGVEVWGTNNQSQQISAAQGKLEVLTGSRIEHAKCGARNWHANNLATTGGIIIGNNGNFLNNAIDVEFKPYHNKSVTNKPTGNLSSFTDCTFETNDNYLFATAPIHVSIFQCEGIKFRGCTLANNRTGSYPASLAGYGINAFEGGFSVLPYYSMLQSPNLKPSSFSNFYRGIYTSKSSNNQPFFVSNTTFNNNVVGILNSGVDNAVITNNTFNVSLGNPMSNIQSGIILRHASGFIIEENSFTSVQNATEKRGIIIFNSGASDNEIYKNNFIGLGLANAAIGINHDNNSLAGPYLHGLQYLCNNNQINTNYDFYVSELNEPNYGVNGIRLNQGSQNIPAGNTFSHINNGSSDFYNNTSSSLNYYYSATGNQIPLYINAPFVNKLYVDKENLCPSHINDGTMQNKLTASQVEEIIQTYDSSEAAYLNVLYAYNQLMDGGNTNALLNQIQLSWPQDAWDLRTELLSMSPYLSQDVLREAANRNILPQAMLLEICLANPDATKDMGFIDLLRAEMANPLPQYMIDLIVDSWDESTNRTSLESSLAFFSHQMAMAGNTLLADLYYGNFLINDSLNSNNSYSYNDSLNYWLNRIQTLTAKYDLIESYISTNDMYAAQNELNNIPSNFNLSEDQSQEYDSYLQYFNFRRDVIAAGRTMSELTETEIEQLTTFAESRNNLATVLAQNFLCAYYQICFDVDFEIPESQDRMMHHAANGNSNEINSLQVAPNPAYIQTTFSYNFPLLKESATLLVCDITGRVVKQFTIINHIGQLLWDTRDVTKGLYFYSVKEGKKLFANGKIAVEK